MSAEARPITPTRFASAIKDLSISSLYNKAGELNNSISHLRSSNDQLKNHLVTSGADDAELRKAIVENEYTIQQMEQRVLLLEFEVEKNRGAKWDPANVDALGLEPGEIQRRREEAAVIASVAATENFASSTGGANGAGGRANGDRSGTLSDEELRKRIEDLAGGSFLNGDSGSILPPSKGMFL